MRYLAIDLGDKRTGLAVGDVETGFVTPLEVIQRSRTSQHAELLRAIRDAIDEHGPDGLVIGLPLNMDGTEGDRAKIVRTFAAELAASTKLTIYFQDERLTSFAAEQHLDRSGRTHKQKKHLRDALAAAEILRDFLATQTNRPFTTESTEDTEE